MELSGASEAKKGDRRGIDCRRIGREIECVWGKVIKPEMCWKVTHADQHIDGTLKPHHLLKLEQQCVSEPSAEQRGKQLNAKRKCRETESRRYKRRVKWGHIC